MLSVIDSNSGQVNRIGGEVQSFDEPGDTITFEDSDSDAEVPLEDVGGESNQDQEFYMVLINSGSSGLGYHLSYVTPSEEEPTDTGLPLGLLVILLSKVLSTNEMVRELQLGSVPLRSSLQLFSLESN